MRVSKQEKIDMARDFIEELSGYYENSANAPMDPHVYFDLNTGEISIQSALSPHDEGDMQIGRMGDLYDWYAITYFEASAFTDSDLISVWDQTAEAAEKNRLDAKALYEACIEMVQAEAEVEAAEAELFLAD